MLEGAILNKLELKRNYPSFKSILRGILEINYLIVVARVSTFARFISHRWNCSLKYIRMKMNYKSS